jgi:hypothetical protein
LGWPLEKALKAATINSSSVVRHADTQSGLLNLPEIEANVAEDKTLEIRRWPIPKG